MHDSILGIDSIGNILYMYKFLHGTNFHEFRTEKIMRKLVSRENLVELTVLSMAKKEFCRSDK